MLRFSYADAIIATGADMLTDERRRFLETARVAHLATADRQGQPHVVPICYALVGEAICFTIDEKPKRTTTELKRLDNIRANPKVALVVDRYDEDWSKLGWLMIQGEARILTDGDLHQNVQRRLRERYSQLRSMGIETLPVVVISVTKVLSWGRLEAMPARQTDDSGQS